MMYITNEYTTIYNRETTKEKKILPGVPFEAFEFSGIVTAYALIKDVETGKGLFPIQPGQTITGVGEVVKETAKSLDRKTLKQMCIEAGITIKSKATIAELREALEG